MLNMPVLLSWSRFIGVSEHLSATFRRSSLHFWIPSTIRVILRAICATPNVIRAILSGHFSIPSIVRAVLRGSFSNLSAFRAFLSGHFSPPRGGFLTRSRCFAEPSGK